MAACIEKRQPMDKQSLMHGPVLLLPPGGFGHYGHKQGRRARTVREVPEGVNNLSVKKRKYSRKDLLKIPATRAAKITVFEQFKRLCVSCKGLIIHLNHR